jgi:uncharacterized repeat protein (TIGR01451 family)
MKKHMMSLLAITLLTGALQAEEKPKISMETHSYQLTVVKNKKGKVVKDKQGKPIKKWLTATKVVPGTIVKYVDTITNESDALLKDAKITNPINENLIFVEGSAASEVAFSVKYSVDGGKHYDVPAKLFVIGKDKKKHPAQAKDYNAILFNVDEVPAHSKIDVSFKVKLK